MNRVMLLEALKVRQTEDLNDLLMPTVPKKDKPSVLRPVEIFKGKLPDRKSETEKAPYIVNAVLNSNFYRNPGEEPTGLCTIRSTMCVYNENNEEGSLMILNLLERLRISYLKNPIVDGVFELMFDEEHPIQDLVYPDETMPFFMADQVTVWKLPPVEREVRAWL